MLHGTLLASGPVIPNFGGPPGGKHGCIARNGLFCWISRWSALSPVFLTRETLRGNR